MAPSAFEVIIMPILQGIALGLVLGPCAMFVVNAADALRKELTERAREIRMALAARHGQIAGGIRAQSFAGVKGG
jgi:hypothetical protein